MKLLCPLLMTLALALSASAAAASARPPALYSFAELCRLGDAAEAAPEPYFELRDVADGAAADFSFAVSPPRGGERWALFLAGLLACAWVAHRRLTSPY